MDSQVCIPSCLGDISSLGILDLSNNQLSTVKLEQLTTIVFLYLSGNNFWGQISDFPLYGWKIWNVLDLSNNQLSGMLPRLFVNSTQLYIIDLSKNHFKGPIPRNFCKLQGGLNIWTFLKTTCMVLYHLASIHHI
jgi:Leucine-rich repeat (LRR) protein